MRTRRAAGFLGTVMALALGQQDAAGSRLQESLFQDDDALIHASPAEADAAMAELRRLGVDRVRLSVIWRDLAPEAEPPDAADPAGYDPRRLEHLDTAIKLARSHGIEVLLNVRGGGPAWGIDHVRHGPLAGRDGLRPDAARFGAFVRMVGRRYDGTYPGETDGQPLPRVTAWSVWNEPNWGGHLQPQSVRDRHTRRLRTVAPRLYRRLFRAATDALAATGHGGDTILAGETAPIGSRKLGHLSPLSPVRFLRDLLCLDRRLRPLPGARARRLGCDFAARGPLRASGYAHHPYSVMSAPDSAHPDPGAITLADGRRLYRVLDAATRAGRLPARLPVWYTEFGYQTAPPDPFRGVSLAEQARWLAEAEHLTWRDRRVSALTQFLLRDDEPVRLFPPEDRRHWRTYQSGLRFQDGRAKPAYDAYRLPLVAPRGLPADGEPLELWGLVRPGVTGEPQRVRIQHRASAREPWTAVGDVELTDPRGAFTVRLPSAREGEYRYEWLRRAPSAAPAGRTASPGLALR